MTQKQIKFITAKAAEGRYRMAILLLINELMRQDRRIKNMKKELNQKQKRSKPCR
jgi:hypothetical protein